MRPERLDSAPNEVLEAVNGKREELASTGSRKSSDQAVAAMEGVNGDDRWTHVKSEVRGEPQLAEVVYRRNRYFRQNDRAPVFCS
jgi:hypothetical protein